MVELVVAVTLMGILMAILGPRLGATRDRGSVRSAKQKVTAYLATTRAAAIRRGRPATFHASGGTIWVSVGGTDTVAARISLSGEYSVAFEATTDSVRFDARGFATNVPGTQVFRLSRAGYSDSVCVSRGGMVATRCGF
jgi:type II secretory pathway pseudopilin PulG